MTQTPPYNTGGSGGGGGSGLTAAQSADLARIDSVLPDLGASVPVGQGFTYQGKNYINDTSSSLTMPFIVSHGRILDAGFTEYRVLSDADLLEFLRGKSVLSQASGTEIARDIDISVNKTGNTDAITVARRIVVTNSSTGANYQPGAHDVVHLNHYIQNGETVALVICGEEKIEGTGNINTAILRESQVVNVSGQHDMLISQNTSINNSTGTFPLVLLNNLSINDNEATIGTIVGMNLANWAEGSGSIADVIGILRPSPDGSNEADYKIIYNLDPNAPIDTLGQIVGSARQEIGSSHPGNADNRYYFPANSAAIVNDGLLAPNALHGSVFINPGRRAYNRIGIPVTTGETGKSAQFYIYEMQNGIPKKLVTESPVVSLPGTGSTGDAEAVIDVTLEAGAYFVAFNTDATASTGGKFRYCTLSASMLGSNNTDGVDTVPVLYRLLAFGQTAPADFDDIPITYFETSITPYLYLRFDAGDSL